MTRRTPRLVPAVEGEELIRTLVPNGERFLDLARTGSHMQNEYHNLSHELGVVYWSYACATNSRSLGEHCGQLIDDDPVPLLLAALFHDHNHSGGARTDDINVDRAFNFVTLSPPFRSLSFANIQHALIAPIIQVTEFLNGKFTLKPTDFAEQCIRDADLMSIYSVEGRTQLMGLFREMGANIDDLDVLKGTLIRNAAFLNTAEMFTPFGKMMKEEHLAKSLKLLEEQALNWHEVGAQLSGLK